MFINKTSDGLNNVCGKNISFYRNQMKLSQRELADKLQLVGLDIDKNAIQRIECGKRFVTDIEIIGFTKVFNITFEELLKLGVIPIVNENDTVSTYELQFGDNDRLSAIVAALIKADLLILLSDIDGLFTDDPNTNPDARFIDVVEKIDNKLIDMGKSTSSSDVGTGGMSAKIAAATIATSAGADMIISNGNDIENIARLLAAFVVDIGKEGGPKW